MNNGHPVFFGSDAKSHSEFPYLRLTDGTEFMLRVYGVRKSNTRMIDRKCDKWPSKPLSDYGQSLAGTPRYKAFLLFSQKREGAEYFVSQREV